MRVHFFGKILIRILNPKTDFLFLWQNPKRDYESNESVRDEDSVDKSESVRDEDSVDKSESGFLGFTTFIFLRERNRKKFMW